MNALFSDSGGAVRGEVRAIIDRHGLGRVLAALAGAAFTRRRPAALRPDEMSDHMRRDLGLPPRSEVPGLRGRSARSGPPPR